MDKSYKVFVGGLPVRVDRDAVAEFFAAYGTVLNCKLKKNQQTGRSLGFAYLTVKEKATYDRLLAETVVFQGRVIDVKPMWKKKELGDKLEEEKKKKIFVSNLPQDLTNPELMAYFSRFGQVLNAFIIKDPDTAGCKDYGYVIFKDLESIEKLASEKSILVLKEHALQWERCTNAAQIAIAKQTRSNRTSKQSLIFVEDAFLDPLQSPTIEELAGCRFLNQRLPSKIYSERSTGSQGKLDGSSTFSLFGHGTKIKCCDVISKFPKSETRPKEVRGSATSPLPYLDSQVMLGASRNPAKTGSSFIIKAPTSAQKQQESDVAWSNLFSGSTKELVLKARPYLNENEANYVFRRESRSRHALFIVARDPVIL
jgi:RNA recognition motif-containing protein